MSKPSKMKVLKAPMVAFAALSVFGATMFPGTAGADPGDHQTPSQQPLSALVDAYESHQPFRGVDNENLPSTLAGGLSLGNVTAFPDGDKTGVSHDGYVDYGLTSDGTHIIAASDGPRMDRFGIIIDEGGPDHYTIGVELPDDTTVKNLDSGAIEVTASDNTVTTLAPALAVDAAGTVLDASYRIEGGKLNVAVDLSSAQFPVLVDPVSSSYWWGTQTWYSRADVRQSASWYGVTRIATVACNAMPSWAGSACRATVGAYTGWIYNTWIDAKNNNQCLWMKMTWTGQVTGIGRYACNWG